MRTISILVLVVCGALTLSCDSGSGDDSGAPRANDGTHTPQAAPLTSTAAARLSREPAIATVTQLPTMRDANALVDALRARALPIGDRFVVTAANDPNMLLGRPGAYTSKVNFRDTRLSEQGRTFELPNGGSIEVFAHEADASARRDYIQNVTRGNPLLTEYTYAVGAVVLRLSSRLTPEQAAAYETALREVLSS